MANMREHSFDLVMVGGGPASIFAAIQFAERCPDANIVILEKTDRLLQKVLISGGGRCNLTHDCNDPRELINFYPRGGKSLLNAFYQFGPKDTIGWFNSREVNFYVDDDGCYFPSTNRSQTIIDILLNRTNQLGIKTWTQVAAERISIEKETQYYIHLSSGDQLLTPRLLMATGGNRQALKMIQALGENVIPPVPSLFSFIINDYRLEGLPGLTVSPAKLSIPGSKFSQVDDLLITHRGLSGPAAINLSAWAARYFHEHQYQLPLEIDWLPLLGNIEEFYASLWQYRETHSTRLITNRCPFPQLVHRLWERLCQSAGIDEKTRWADLSKKRIRTLAQELRKGQFKIDGRNQQKQEYVTCGGVDLKSIHLKTMQSKLFPNLFYAGEVLNIDGLTGGYNLQNCWTTGWIAGNSMPCIVEC